MPEVLSDNTGALTSHSFTYDAYGVMLASNPADTSGSTSLLYAGEQFDTDLQQYYLRARFYDPLNGRFNRTDPFAGSPHDPQSLHKYLYCHANPVNMTDPSGKMGMLGWAITIVVIFAIAAVLYRAYFFEPQQSGLGDSRITNNDIVDSITGAESAIQKMPDVLATEPETWQQYQDALANNNIYGVGLLGVGVVQMGYTLSQGRQLIIEYFESPVWIANHPDIFSAFPKPHELHLDPVGWFQRQGEAEVNRMKAVVAELKEEARRRGIQGYRSN